MTTGTALRQGFSLAQRVRSAVWIIFLVNLGLAALAGLPIYQGILRFTGYSLMSQSLVHGFSTDWLADFSINSPGSLDRYAAVIALFGLLSIPVNSVLAGGVLARFRAPEQTCSLADFFGNTTRYAWRLLRLMMIGLVCYWIIFRVLNQWLRNLVDMRTRDWLDDRPIFGFHLAVYLAVFLAIAFVNVVMDYARIQLIAEDGSSAVEAFLASLGFSIGRLRRAGTVYAFPSLCGFALLGLYRWLMPWSQINGPLLWLPWADIREPLALALLFIGQQAIMFGRYWFRVAAWASEWSLYTAAL